MHTRLDGFVVDWCLIQNIDKWSFGVTVENFTEFSLYA